MKMTKRTKSSMRSISASRLSNRVPPVFRNESADLYLGYFANQYGEQWILTFDRATREATLRGGDVDWRTVNVVLDGRADGLILSSDQATWLHRARRSLGARLEPEGAGGAGRC